MVFFIVTLLFLVGENNYLPRQCISYSFANTKYERDSRKWRITRDVYITPPIGK